MLQCSISAGRSVRIHLDCMSSAWLPALQTSHNAGHHTYSATLLCAVCQCACLPHVADGLSCPGPRPAQHKQCQLTARATQHPLVLTSAACSASALVLASCLGQLFAVCHALTGEVQNKLLVAQRGTRQAVPRLCAVSWRRSADTKSRVSGRTLAPTPRGTGGTLRRWGSAAAPPAAAPPAYNTTLCHLTET